MNSFNWKQYLTNYPDLNRFNTEQQAIRHYLRFGKSEGRTDKNTMELKMELILNSPAFVIHLESLTSRKEFFTKNIKEAGFTDMRIFKGVNGYDENDVNENLKLHNNPTLSLGIPKGALGCALSHFNVLKYIIDNNIKYATIFEDDVHFHPQWKELSELYLSKTPSDFDVIFIGNGIDNLRKDSFNNNVSIITTESCFCTHCYFVTNKGAKQLYNLLNWRYDLFKLKYFIENIGQIFNIDCQIKFTQMLINDKTIPQSFIWYCWNGTIFPCEFNKLPLNELVIGNSGLVFQAFYKFGSSINNINKI